MRLDAQTALADLERSVALLMVDAVPDGEYTARILDFVNTLFGNPLISAAIDTALDHRQYRADAKALSRLSIAEVLAPPVARAIRLAGVVYRDAANSNLTGAGLSKFRDVLQEPFTRADTGTTDVLRSFFEAAEEEHFALSYLSVSSAAHLLELSQRLHRVYNSMNNSGFADLRSFGAWDMARREATTGLERMAHQSSIVSSVCDEYSLDPFVAQLRDLAVVLRGLLDGTILPPFESNHVFGILYGLGSKDTPNGHQFRRRASRLVAILAAQLRRGSVKRHVIHRLSAFLQHFAKHDLIGRLRYARAEHIGGSLEAILQREVDAFIFSEGLFPITHAAAAGGNFDTFVEAHQALFDGARSSGEHPFLLELKQVLLLNGTSADYKHAVRHAIDLAIQQSREYSNHLRCNLGWGEHDVTAMVVYDGPTRFWSNRAELIYLGDAPPSRGAVDLDV